MGRKLQMLMLLCAYWMCKGNLLFIIFKGWIHVNLVAQFRIHGSRVLPICDTSNTFTGIWRNTNGRSHCIPISSVPNSPCKCSSSSKSCPLMAAQLFLFSLQAISKQQTANHESTNPQQSIFAYTAWPLLETQSRTAFSFSVLIIWWICT